LQAVIEDFRKTNSCASELPRGGSGAVLHVAGRESVLTIAARITEAAVPAQPGELEALLRP
jgi:hypothetical protein